MKFRTKCVNVEINPVKDSYSSKKSVPWFEIITPKGARRFVPEEFMNELFEPVEDDGASWSAGVIRNQKETEL